MKEAHVSRGYLYLDPSNSMLLHDFFQQSRSIANFEWLRHDVTALMLKSGIVLVYPHCRSPQILRFLVKAALRMPRLAIAFLLLALVALAGTMSYAGYLVVGIVADHLGTGRLMAGLLLGVLFARLPWIREGKLRTIGLLPKRARLPVMVALLAFCLLSYLYRGALVPVLFLGFAMTFLLAYRQMRQMIVNRAISSLFKSSSGPNHPKSTDDKVIDVEFREKKD